MDANARTFEDTNLRAADRNSKYSFGNVLAEIHLSPRCPGRFNPLALVAGSDYIKFFLAFTWPIVGADYRRQIHVTHVCGVR